VLGAQSKIRAQSQELLGFLQDDENGPILATVLRMTNIGASGED
jgi:hypothetical protein